MTAPFGSGVARNAIPVTTAGNSQTTIVTVMGRDATVTSVTYTPAAGVTGANTNTRSVSLVNKGTDGSGSTVIATLQFNSGVNATAAVPRTITLSATASDLQITSGQVLQWQSTAVGTGITDPGGLVSVTTAAKYA
jgi:copper(I)-binding protein